MTDWVEIDFESVSALDLKVVGSARYWEDPTTDILCLSWEHSDGRHGTWYPGQPRPAVFDEPNLMFVAHNAGFEKDAWRAVLVKVLGWPDIPNSRWHDSQAVAAMKVIPVALEDTLRIMRIPVQKDMEGNKITLSLSKLNKRTGMMPVITDEIRERVGQYCETDVAGQALLNRRLGWLPEGERRVWLLNQRMNERGVRLDMPLVNAMQEVVDKASLPLAKEFADLTGGLKMTQGKKVLGWMMDRGVILPNMTKETLAQALGSDEDGEEVFDPGEYDYALPPDVERALTIRQLIGSSSIKKLKRMKQVVMLDGRARRLFQYHGTGPGRSAGRLFQPQNFPTGSDEMAAFDPETRVAAIMTGDPAHVEATIGPAVEAVVSSLRHTIVAGKGRVLVSGDYAGIQARTVLGLAGQHDKAALMASGVDVYIDMACEIWPELRFDLTNEELVKKFKKEHGFERKIGKNSVLGLGFQMGDKTFQFKYAKDRPLLFCTEVVQTYRKKWAPKVPNVWSALQRASLDAVHYRKPQEAYGVTYALEDEWLTARLPSGRKMWYFNPQLVRRHMPWSTPEEPDVRLAWTYQATKNKRLVTIDSFGGQVTENVVMGIERDIMTHAMLLMEQNGFPVVMEVHDEIVAEPLLADADEEAFKQIMLDSPDWVKHYRIPIATDGWIGERYRK